jgi:uncharacterized membrane protein HdeD (DUF308 family)
MTNSSAFASGATPIGSMLARDLASSWWVLLLRGLAAITFGVLTFMWPGISLLSLTLIWGTYALVDGVLSLGAALFRSETKWGSRWWLGLIGVTGIVAGIGAFVYPGMTTYVLLMFIAVWAIIVGALQIVGAIRLRQEINNEWLLGLSGLLSIVFGVYTIMHPDRGALALIWVIGGYAIVSGAISLIFSFKVKRLGQPQT